MIKKITDTVRFVAGNGAVDGKGLRCDLLVDSQRSSLLRAAVYNVHPQLLHCARAETVVSPAGGLQETPHAPSKNHVTA